MVGTHERSDARLLRRWRKTQNKTSRSEDVKKINLGASSFASADSSTVARNIGIDKNWRGFTAPRNKQVRAFSLGSNLENVEHATVWNPCLSASVQPPENDWLAELT